MGKICAWQKQESVIKTVTEKNLIEKQLERSHSRWRDCVAKDAEAVETGIQWRIVVEDKVR